MSAEAIHETVCSLCDRKIKEGDSIDKSRVTGKWVHTECPPQKDPLAPQNKVCTVCWLDHPPGMCDR